MKNTMLLAVVTALLVSSLSHAQTTVWNPAGNPIYDPNTGDPNAVYDPNTPQDWSDAGNWTNGLPLTTPGSKAVLNVPSASEVQISNAQSAYQISMGDGTDGSTLRIVNGGSLTTGNVWTAVGYNAVGHLVVETGGSASFGEHLWLGFLPTTFFGEKSVVDVDGGTITVNNVLGFNQGSDSFGDGGDAEMNVTNGGLVNVLDRMDLGSVDGQGTLNINSGGVVDARFFRNDGTIVVGNGGLLKTAPTSWSSVGQRATSPTGGVLNVETGGEVQFGQHLWVGFEDPNATGTININGGTVSVGAMLGIGWDGADPNSDGSGTGTINVNEGGVLDLFQMHADGESSIEQGSALNINGSGEVRLPGNYTSVLDSYISNGRIFGNGQVGNVLVTVGPAGGPLAGDFNGDGRVDAEDFLDWQRNPSLGDLSDWEADYGQAPPEQTVVTALPPVISAVPEPSSVALLIVCVTFLSNARRRSG